MAVDVVSGSGVGALCPSTGSGSLKSRRSFSGWLGMGENPFAMGGWRGFSGIRMKSNIYKATVFDMACRQFDRAADILEMDARLRERVKMPKRCMVVSCPIKMDTREVVVFEGYRVQHHLAMGPTKGGLRFHPQVELGEVAALAKRLHGLFP